MVGARRVVSLSISVGLALGVGLVLASCGAGERPASDYLVRDSAGVRIVETSGAQWRPGQEWRLGSEPRLEIGSEDSGPEYQFWFISGATLLSDGRLVVLDRRANNLRFFGPDGVHLATIGRAGSGPSEFQMPIDLVRLPGDTLVVLDRQHGFSVSSFSAEGQYLGRVVMPPDFLEPMQMSGLAILLADGSLLYRVTSIAYLQDHPFGASREPMGLFRASPLDGRQAIDTIGWFDGTEMYRARSMSSYPPFAARGLYLRGRGGPLVAQSETGEVMHFDNDGRLVQITRPRVPRRPLTRADYAEHEERVMASDEAGERARWESFFAAVPKKAEMPALDDLHVDSEGNLWLEHFRPTGAAPLRWTVIDPAGRTLGEVAGPERLKVLGIGADYLVGVWKDEFDVQYIRVYDLIKG